MTNIINPLSQPNPPSLTSDPKIREQSLSQWVGEQSGLDKAITLRPITNDAGFRRYFRFASPSEWLAVDAPPQTEDSRQFIALARYLSLNNVNTPKIHAADEQQGFLLVEDFGDDLLHGKLTDATADKFYQQAFETLINLQSCPDNQQLVPRYDGELLRRELLIFNEWFVTGLLGYSLNSAETSMLDTMFSKLEASALDQPQSLVHRDFHSRNLLVRTTKNEPLGVIDFQGALWGACTYDLVSLLRDCYIRWPATDVKRWALEFRSLAIQSGLLNGDTSEAEYLRWFDWIGLQRHIKVLGIFARLHLRDHKHHYLQDLPLVIRYTLEVTEAYPGLRTFSNWFKEKLLPIAQQQNWYSDYRKAGDTGRDSETAMDEHKAGEER